MDLTTVAIVIGLGCMCLVGVAVVAAVVYWIWKNSKHEPTLK